MSWRGSELQKKLMWLDWILVKWFIFTAGETEVLLVRWIGWFAGKLLKATGRCCGIKYCSRSFEIEVMLMKILRPWNQLWWLLLSVRLNGLSWELYCSCRLSAVLTSYMAWGRAEGDGCARRVEQSVSLMSWMGRYEMQQMELLPRL